MRRWKGELCEVNLLLSPGLLLLHTVTIYNLVHPPPLSEILIGGVNMVNAMFLRAATCVVEFPWKFRGIPVELPWDFRGIAVE